MKLLSVLLGVALFAYNANAQSSVSFYLSAGANSMTSQSCGLGQNVNIGLQFYSNSSVYFYTGVPPFSSVPCSNLNFTLVQGASVGPAILASFSKCVSPSNPTAFCTGFTNTGSGAGNSQANIVYLLTVSCGCTIPPVENTNGEIMPSLLPGNMLLDHPLAPVGETPFDRLVRLLKL